MTDWKTIDSAPKDGTKILVLTLGGDIELSEWFQNWGVEYIPVDGTDLFRKEQKLFYEGWNSNGFTHWMPLPHPPK